MSDGSNSERKTETRGQLVLVAAILVAVALVPIVFTYLQFGYDADIEANSADDHLMMNAERVLGRAVHEVGTNISAEYSWRRQDAAVTGVRDHLQPHIAVLERSRIAAGVVYQVSYNDSAATAWSDANCPGGVDRQFGSCETEGGVIVQERIGETHVIAVALDVRVTTDRGYREATVIVPVVE